ECFPGPYVPHDHGRAQLLRTVAAGSDEPRAIRTERHFPSSCTWIKGLRVVRFGEVEENFSRACIPHLQLVTAVSPPHFLESSGRDPSAVAAELGAEHTFL